MLVRHSRWSGPSSVRCCIACVGYPPDCGQSALSTGFGRLTGSLRRAGSGSSVRSSVSTETRSPLSFSLAVSAKMSLNQLHPATVSSSPAAVRRARTRTAVKASLRERRDHLGRPRAQILRRRQIVGHALIGRPRRGLVAALEFGKRGEFQGGRVPWACRRRQRRNLLDDRLGVTALELVLG